MKSAKRARAHGACERLRDMRKRSGPEMKGRISHTLMAFLAAAGTSPAPAQVRSDEPRGRRVQTAFEALAQDAAE
jgi:hypothetical protein